MGAKLDCQIPPSLLLLVAGRAKRQLLIQKTLAGRFGGWRIKFAISYLHSALTAEVGATLVGRAEVRRLEVPAIV